MAVNINGVIKRGKSKAAARIRRRAGSSRSYVPPHTPTPRSGIVTQGRPASHSLEPG